MAPHAGEHPDSVRSFEMIETTALRKRAEAAIDALLALLDEMDGDPDLEEAGDDEPALGWEGGAPDRFFRVSPWTLARSYDDTDREQDAGDEPEGPDTDREYAALERHGMGFIRSGLDDTEEDDPAGGDVLDEPHDADTFTDIIADDGAMALLHEEIWFQDRMVMTFNERRDASNAALQSLANVTGRTFQSFHWPLTLNPANDRGMK